MFCISLVLTHLERNLKKLKKNDNCKKANSQYSQGKNLPTWEGWMNYSQFTIDGTSCASKCIQNNWRGSPTHQGHYIKGSKVHMYILALNWELALPRKTTKGARKAPVHREPRNVLEQKRGMEAWAKREERRKGKLS